MIVAENLFFWTEADLKSNTPHINYNCPVTTKLLMKVKNDHRNQFPIEAIGTEKPGKIRASTAFEALTSVLKLEIYCNDHSSLSSTTAVQIWIVSFLLHIISLLRGEMNSIN